MSCKRLAGCQKLIVGVFLSFLTVSAIAAEYRCGWLENPTPGNWWLNDKDGSWTISAQGGYSVPDKSLDNLPDIKDSEFVRTNIHYGYTCACMSVTVDKQNNLVTAIHNKGKQLTLKKCLEDRNLPGRNDWETDEKPQVTSTTKKPEATANAPYFIQVFSTISSSSADKVKNSLVQKGFKTLVVPHQGSESTLYRVRVGPYSSKEVAINAQINLKSVFKNDSGIQKSIIVQQAATTNIPPPQTMAQETQCYSKKEGKDITAVELTQKQGKVSGYYTWAPYEKDGAYGSFTGTQTGNEIRAIYTYMIEGSIQAEEVAFRRGNNLLLQGKGELVDKKGGSYLKNPTKLDWTESFSIVNCNTINDALNNAKEVSKAIQKELSSN